MRRKKKPFVRKKKQKLPSYTGYISLHKKGFGFVEVEKKKEVFIAPHLTGGALHGEKVAVEIISRSKKGFEGKITKIYSGKNRLIVAHVISTKPLEVFSPFIDETKNIIVTTTKIALKQGDRVALKIQERKTQEIYCIVDRIIGSIEDASIDVEAALLQFDLKADFPQTVLATLKKITEKDDLQRIDCREQPAITIDPKDAKDYDDAIYIHPTKDGYDLFVHIADVSSFIPEKSPLDQEAFRRGNSTYFPGFVVPMLPQELSNDLCSLKENVDRRAASVKIVYDKEGNVLSATFFRSLICSKKRFTYEEAKEVLDGKKKSPWKEQLSHMVELALLLKKKRKERGSLDLSLKENKIVCDQKGRPVGITTVHYDITHQMIEEFMLAANERVAMHLSKHCDEALYRVHEIPSKENMDDFFMYARILGFSLPVKPSLEDIIGLFAMAKDTPYLEDLAIRYIRSMKMAMYSTENIGHFGLALDHYTHFTSPIRRYSDLVVHRLLFDQTTALPLDKVASHTSKTERNSFKAEIYVITMKKLRYIDNLVKENPDLIFEATITKIRKGGFSFDLKNIGYEDQLSASDLPKGNWVYHEPTFTLVNENSKQFLKIGQSIKLKPVEVSLLLEKIQWKWVS